MPHFIIFFSVTYYAIGISDVIVISMVIKTIYRHICLYKAYGSLCCIIWVKCFAGND